jgi:hypothetical protein
VERSTRACTGDATRPYGITQRRCVAQLQTPPARQHACTPVVLLGALALGAVVVVRGVPSPPRWLASLLLRMSGAKGAVQGRRSCERRAPSRLPKLLLGGGACACAGALESGALELQRRGCASLAAGVCSWRLGPRRRSLLLLLSSIGPQCGQCSGPGGVARTSCRDAPRPASRLTGLGSWKPLPLGYHQLKLCAPLLLGTRIRNRRCCSWCYAATTCFGFRLSPLSLQYSYGCQPCRVL